MEVSARTDYRKDPSWSILQITRAIVRKGCDVYIKQRHEEGHW
jgi:hypothetical protein